MQLRQGTHRKLRHKANGREGLASMTRNCGEASDSLDSKTMSAPSTRVDWEEGANMLIIGVDYHSSFQQIDFWDQGTAECGERRLNHSDGEAVRFYRELQRRRVSVRVGMAEGRT